ncbi:hybrid sensor histidine kinase/response regulator [Beijerinckia indica]|uniref:histidine kinase n=1 Tax=Beijerinckia indica subsp. indica (strain ATCC 9039 / DSM 1715 / NCIMB 8712) TaxID=395963 RepID=B2II36_BEII9|nr:ATP-binding protein [Beijerinckia indica]ACB94619.1 integral membrane sensor hybrid histidine kinase [Beijerinckia indica subsp. indica ATCC 9039]
MAAEQKIIRVRRRYNQWVVNETLEDYALRFTAKNSRRWSVLRVANTALGAVAFLALEAIGGAITLSYGFSNAVTAILVVCALIFATGLPISYYAAKYGVDIDLLTRGAGFGYIGSTLTSLIYASFTYLFFAIEAAIMALALEMCFGVPLMIGYFVSALVVIPLVTHGITFISRFQLWTQPLWIFLNVLPFLFITWSSDGTLMAGWTGFPGLLDGANGSFDLVRFGLASTLVFAVITQIGEQVDFLRFLPRRAQGSTPGVSPTAWWVAMISAGPGWVVPGGLKMLGGSFLAYYALQHGVPFSHAAEPTQMYLIAFKTALSPQVALAFTGLFVIVAQLKINVTNSYAGSIAWSNFFSRLTHSHPGRVVWLVFNVAIALMLMTLGIYKILEKILGLYSIIAVAWVAAIVADLIVNKPLGLSPPGIEFKRAHLYDINPVGVGAVMAGTGVAVFAFAGVFGPLLQACAPFLALFVSFSTAPLIAFLTKGRYYIARHPRENWHDKEALKCCICKHKFEIEDMAHCPAYDGPICSLCCSLDARCNDRCKTEARFPEQILAALGAALPAWIMERINSRLGHYLGVLAVLASIIAAILGALYLQAALAPAAERAAIGAMLFTLYFILLIIAGIAAWLFVLTQESRSVAQEESHRQTALLRREIEAHKRTDQKLQKAKEVAEAANLAKSRFVVGLSHELRTPLNAIMGYAQILERDVSIPSHRRNAIRVMHRSAEHLSGLIDGLLDISKIEAGRLHLSRDEVRFGEFLDHLVDMFRLQATAKGIDFVYIRSEHLPAVVFTDEKRLRQILINLLTNAIKFTAEGRVTLRVSYRYPVARFEIEDTGMGISRNDQERIFYPFERGQHAGTYAIIGIGLGLTITKLLTEIMGGEICLTSEIGVGSTFQVKIMLSEATHPVHARPIEQSIRGYLGPRRTVLVADDNVDHRDLMHELLIPLGFTVLSAPDGVAAMEMVRQWDPDLLLLDISMPNLDGWEVARQLRDEGFTRLRIIIISANAGEIREDVMEKRYHDDQIVKPVHLPGLLEKVQTLLDLEWTDQVETGETKAPLRPPLSIRPPASDHIAELIKLGEIGYVRGIQAKLNEMETLSSEHDAFVAHMRDLMDVFDLKQYMTLLEAIRRDDA